MAGIGRRERTREERTGVCDGGGSETRSAIGATTTKSVGPLTWTKLGTDVANSGFSVILAYAMDMSIVPSGARALAFSSAFTKKRVSA